MSADSGGGLTLLGILFAAYFAPTIIAVVRRHHNAAAIAMLNILLGWTLLGWIIAFVWSCTATIREMQSQARAADVQAQGRIERQRTTEASSNSALWVLLLMGCVGLVVIVYLINQSTDDHPSPTLKPAAQAAVRSPSVEPAPDHSAVRRDQNIPALRTAVATKPRPAAPSLEQVTHEKFGPKLAEAKRLVDAKDFNGATQILREIVDEAPLTNLSIEARRLLKSLPSDDVKTRSDKTP